ncbi:hypothetical protein [Helicobacter bizzozeronii]|uniref:hypothetical protein n=1 Tax=Helicobacter bizzozeronii TaxID=56877 RepID=UPI000CEE56DA|nr:hypothetical protein [Helicobacter bizzozeronii]
MISDLPELPIIAKSALPAKALNSGASLKDITKPPLKAQFFVSMSFEWFETIKEVFKNPAVVFK